MQALGQRNLNIDHQDRRNGKRKQNVIDDPGAEDVDYTSTRDRPAPSPQYRSMSRQQLDRDFPMFFKVDVSAFASGQGGFYAPAFIKLYDAAVRNAPLGAVRRTKKPRVVPRTRVSNMHECPEFQAEYSWVLEWKERYDTQRLDKKRRKSERLGLPFDPRPPPVPPIGAVGQAAPVLAHFPPAPPPDIVVDGLDLIPDDENEVELPAAELSMKVACGCCFDDECSFETMIQCADGHLFCRDCVTSAATNAVGEMKPHVLCMDQTNCKQPIPPPELHKCIDERTLALLARNLQQSDLKAAELEGLEQCPHCPFAMIFEVGVEQVDVFECRNGECGVRSCRKCWKQVGDILYVFSWEKWNEMLSWNLQEHRGKPCEDEGKLKAEHEIAEAMTKALIRKCPNARCNAEFVKTDGCNKIKCSMCGTYSCYLCRQPLSHLPNPYDHFDRDALAPPGDKCKLWDPKGRGDDPTYRHNEEVEEAERQARAAVRARELGLEHPVAGPARARDEPPVALLPAEAPPPPQAQVDVPRPLAADVRPHPVYDLFMQRAQPHPLLPLRVLQVPAPRPADRDRADQEELLQYRLQALRNLRAGAPVVVEVPRAHPPPQAPPAVPVNRPRVPPNNLPARRP
ncbi:hypothetical protein JAAARDRAFT_203517 [Jaapia argillacea MUCL 33604]|uniref:RING-type domain-containing protein n=1 Tax=Jaapia argillacea MUCL 33604 TaxID=933084 RepID=A0A067QFS2_9AGAM|nr:hypothetical protein JAAARDRAFT_203517 [Jaapia argillacea MUCL 33604]